MARTAKDWRSEAQTFHELAEKEEAAGLNLDAELHYARAASAAAIAQAISTARPERSALAKLKAPQ